MGSDSIFQLGSDSNSEMESDPTSGVGSQNSARGFSWSLPTLPITIAALA